MPAQGRSPAETRRALARWAEASGCRLLVLFGSAAADRRTSPRDVDIALAFGELPDPRSRLRLVGELQDLVSPMPVDVVFLHRDTDPVLRFEVFRRGTPLFEARPGLFVDELVRALSLHEDALPFRRALRDTFRDGGADT